MAGLTPHVNGPTPPVAMSWMPPEYAPLYAQPPGVAMKACGSGKAMVPPDVGTVSHPAICRFVPVTSGTRMTPVCPTESTAMALTEYGFAPPDPVSVGPV